MFDLIISSGLQSITVMARCDIWIIYELLPQAGPHTKLVHPTKSHADRNNVFASYKEHPYIRASTSSAVHTCTPYVVLGTW